VGFNGVYFTIFRAKVWKILIFEWILFQTQISKIGFGRKYLVGIKVAIGNVIRNTLGTWGT
jgi:hypothetical protein